MTRTRRFVVLALVVALCIPLKSSASSRPDITTGDAAVIVSTGHSLSKAPTDTLWVYGGPGTDEGKFQVGVAGNVPDTQGWTGHDLTDIPTYWRISDFNAETLNDHGPGNLALWCGRTAEEEPGWAAGAGYGNSWFQEFLFELQVTNTAAGQTVALDFYFHHELENEYDFFVVEYDSAGSWKRVAQFTGADRPWQGVFEAPGVRYSQQPDVQSIVYAGGDYGGDNQDQIRIRLVVSSDGARSDEDGLWPTDGAVQLDDLEVTCSEGSFFEDFEAGLQQWRFDKDPFVGDFFAVYPRFEDIDPCRENTTPLAGFLDFGQDVNNSASAAFIPGYPTSTGGTLSGSWSYGIPGGWCTNTSGGLAPSYYLLENRMTSPVVDWDLPGTADDEAAYAGAVLNFDVWSHIPLQNCLFYTWSVRSQTEGGAWSAWRNRGYIYYGGGSARWVSHDNDVSNLLVPDAARVQVSLEVVDLRLFEFCHGATTPAPVFDNVGLRKYALAGPAMSTRTIDLANDGFPANGSIDASTLPLRNQLDIPFDMARDVSTGTLNVPGDSLVVDVVSLVPGATLADTRMIWVLDKNPLFEDALRAAPSRPQDENVDTSSPTQWTGEVVGQQSYTSLGNPIENRFFYDLPDVDFLYPGDQVRYYFRSEDSDGRVSTLPDDTTGFLTWYGYDSAFTVRGLPSLSDATGTQHTKLVVNDFGHRGGEVAFLRALLALGFYPDEYYDLYTVQGPASGVGNGIGSAGAHGANANQLAGYNTIVYFTGDLPVFTLSDGSDSGSNDKGDDIGVLTAWHALPGARNAVYFGDNIAFSLERSGPAGAAYLATILGASVDDADVKDEIGGQSAPVILPLDAAFAESFVAYGGCPSINQFDSISPLAPAVRGHGFQVESAPGTVYGDLAASVVHDRLVSGHRKVDITFPFGFHYIFQQAQPGGTGTSVRTGLIREVFDYFGVPSSTGLHVPVPVRPGPASLFAHPTPFNPRTTIELSVPIPGHAVVEIFDLRGRKVRVLHRGELEAGVPAQWTWAGRDEAGASVATGVYVVRAVGPGYSVDTKVVLLK